MSRAKELLSLLCEQELTVYHGTNADFSQFNFDSAAQKIIWFASNRDEILRGDSGAQGTKNLLTLKVRLNKPAGWKEYDQLGLDELQGRGYDGAILPNKDGSFDGFVFDPSQVQIISKERGS